MAISRLFCHYKVHEDVAPSLLDHASSLALTEAALERNWEVQGTTVVSMRIYATAQARKKSRRDALGAWVWQGCGEGAADPIANKNGTRAAKTLSEVLKELTREMERSRSTSAKRTRFAHATEFGQELVGSSSPRTVSRCVGNEVVEVGEIRATTNTAAVVDLAAEAEKCGREEELSALEAVVAEMEVVLAKEKRVSTIMSDNATEVRFELAAAEECWALLQRDATTRMKTLDMLPRARENIAKLAIICEDSAGKLARLAEEWQAYRLPLVEAIEAKRNYAGSRKAKCKDMLDEMKRARAEMQAMTNAVRDKEHQARILDDDLSKMPKNLNRALYTYRIMDIISSISKQKMEIDKIIAEVHLVQKDINSAGERLVRAEELADVKIFATANREVKKDPAMVSSYRYLQTLRIKFDDLITTIGNLGRKETDAREIEGKTEQLAERVSKNHTGRILADIQQVRQENAQLAENIRDARLKNTRRERLP